MSLRILDSNPPNLKDAAFAFTHVEMEVGEPLVSTLAKIPDWGEMDLGLDLHSEYAGKLTSYVRAMVNKRKPGFLATPVIAAAGVNPIYSFATLEEDRWEVSGADAAVRTCIAKLFWGEDMKQADAITGWDRFHSKGDIYEEASDQIGLLQPMANANNACCGFFRHVYGSSTVSSDKAFAQVALWLVSAFANQGAAERHNKYVADLHSKERTRLNMEKAEAMVNVKMTELYRRAAKRDSNREQRAGRLSIAEDLRLVYVHARAHIEEKRALQLRMSALQEEEREERQAEEEGEEPLQTVADAAQVLDAIEAPLTVPEGYTMVTTMPSATMLDATSEASNVLLNRRILLRFEGFGWCKGTIVSKINAGSTTVAGVCRASALISSPSLTLTRAKPPTSRSRRLCTTHHPQLSTSRGCSWKKNSCCSSSIRPE